MKNFKDILEEKVGRGLFDRFDKFYLSVGKELEKEFMKAFGKRGGFKTTLLMARNGAVNLVMKGVNRSDFSVTLRSTFFIKSLTPSTFWIDIEMEAVNQNGISEIVKQTDAPFSSYDPKFYAGATARWLGFK